MADLNHLAILRQGYKAWNKWREENPDIEPDCSRSDLKNANLALANLRKTNLSGADLTDARFDHANLTFADLSYVNLRSTSLFNANLELASLNYAKLFGTKLFSTFFSYTNMYETEFDNSFMSDSNIISVDLSRTHGLETIFHERSSEISFSTIIQYKGNIPEAFLRGAGIPEPFIVNMKSLIAAMEPFQFYSCFISYSSKDQDFADRLYADLQNKGVRCWLATEDLKIGDTFRDKIDEAIRLHDKLLVVLSETSVNSSWVQSEVESAFEKERRDPEHRTVLFPIRLDDAVMDTNKAWAADIRRTRHIGDFTKWKDHDSYQKAFDRLLRDLKGEKSAPDSKQPPTAKK